MRELCDFALYGSPGTGSFRPVNFNRNQELITEVSVRNRTSSHRCRGPTGGCAVQRGDDVGEEMGPLGRCTLHRRLLITRRWLWRHRRTRQWRFPEPVGWAASWCMWFKSTWAITSWNPPPDLRPELGPRLPSRPCVATVLVSDRWGHQIYQIATCSMGSAGAFTRRLSRSLGASSSW